MILGLLRERLQGARRIPLSIGKCLVGFEPFRRILGAPHLSDRARADLAPSPRVSPERFEVLCHHATGDKLSRSRFRRIASTRGNTNNIRKIRMHVQADFSLREVQGLLSEIGGVREIHSADLVDVYSRETRRGEALMFLRTAYTQG